jgi:hypothetical protein
LLLIAVLAPVLMAAVAVVCRAVLPGRADDTLIHDWLVSMAADPASVELVSVEASEELKGRSHAKVWRVVWYCKNSQGVRERHDETLTGCGGPEPKIAHSSGTGSGYKFPIICRSIRLMNARYEQPPGAPIEAPRQDAKQQPLETKE